MLEGQRGLSPDDGGPGNEAGNQAWLQLVRHTSPFVQGVTGGARESARDRSPWHVTSRDMTPRPVSNDVTSRDLTPVRQSGRRSRSLLTLTQTSASPEREAERDIEREGVSRTRSNTRRRDDTPQVCSHPNPMIPALKSALRAHSTSVLNPQRLATLNSNYLTLYFTASLSRILIKEKSPPPFPPQKKQNIIQVDDMPLEARPRAASSAWHSDENSFNAPGTELRQIHQLLSSTDFWDSNSRMSRVEEPLPRSSGGGGSGGRRGGGAGAGSGAGSCAEGGGAKSFQRWVIPVRIAKEDDRGLPK